MYLNFGIKDNCLQKKEELQREGDELNEKVSKAEREIKALQNTLMLMTSKNNNNRSILNTVITS